MTGILGPPVGKLNQGLMSKCVSPSGPHPFLASPRKKGMEISWEEKAEFMGFLTLAQLLLE